MKIKLGIILMLFSFNAFAEPSKTLNNIQLKDINGNNVMLKGDKEKNIYVKMWASWCPICLVGLMEIDELSAVKNKNFDVITIVSPNQKGEKNTEEFIEWYKGLEYKNIAILLDEKGEILERTKIDGYPSSIFLDSELNIKRIIPGHLSSRKLKI